MRSRRGRKLLVASLGVAAVSYVACGGSSSSDRRDTGDASADAAVDAVADAADAAMDALVANLVVPPVDAGPDDASFFDVVANLIPPPPPPPSD